VCLGVAAAHAQDTTNTNRRGLQELNRQNDPAHLYKTDTTNVYQPRADTARAMPRPNNNLYNDSTRMNSNPMTDSTRGPGMYPGSVSERKKKGLR